MNFRVGNSPFIIRRSPCGACRPPSSPIGPRLPASTADGAGRGGQRESIGDVHVIHPAAGEATVDELYGLERPRAAAARGSGSA